MFFRLVTDGELIILKRNISRNKVEKTHRDHCQDNCSQAPGFQEKENRQCKNVERQVPVKDWISDVEFRFIEIF